ncbi:HD domain-containing protein [Clostridium aminobutyricum]|uniref:HD domain-containing protein n=1 Tax=Clostridium aminobutyricum TaxID=33953 RepID=A0A939D980_CLOAM|nr:HD domain-containing protein [Clostridium aminobutyricum]MBN7773420.1 HD domain-containing protein [Clostridium aminobutyricum]
MEKKRISYEDIKNSVEISTYIKRGNDLLGAIGFTEHGFAHAGKVAQRAADILTVLGYDERTIELAKIAGHMHDIGNCINRNDHAQSGAIMAFRILDRMQVDAEEIATIIGAIGNHDEGTGVAFSPISAALILADKSDVRRSRVRYKNRNEEKLSEDIHDRVNYAVHHSRLTVNPESKCILLELEIDTAISVVMEYFEIFLSRMVMCRNAAKFLGLSFELNINNIRLL